MRKADSVDGIQRDHEQLGQVIELLDRYIFHLRYEGKKHTEENIRRIQDHLQFLRSEMSRRIHYEERVLFPFLAMHIPRVEPLFILLRGDHKQFESEFKSLGRSISAGSKDEILLHGDFLLGLLRSHWALEDKNTITPLREELKRHEKDRLSRLWDKLE